MAFTELLPIAATVGSQSAARTVAAGAIERIGLKFTGERCPPDAVVHLQVKDDVGRYITYHHLTSGGQRGSLNIQGPCTYLLERAGGTVGAYVEA